MKKSVFCCLLIIFMSFLVVSCGQKPVTNLNEGKSEESVSTEKIEKASMLVDLLAKKDYTNVLVCFDSTMKNALPPEKLQTAWEDINKQAGTFSEKVDVWTEKQQNLDIVYVTCQFEKTKIDIKVVFNEAKEVSGLWFVPSKK